MYSFILAAGFIKQMVSDSCGILWVISRNTAVGGLTPSKSVSGVVRCRENQVMPVILLSLCKGDILVPLAALCCLLLTLEGRKVMLLSLPLAECFSRLSLCDRILQHKTHVFWLQGCVTQACGVRSQGSNRSTQKSTVRCLCFRCQGFQISFPGWVYFSCRYQRVFWKC